MGGGIALCLARAGSHVVLVSRRAATLEAARARIEAGADPRRPPVRIETTTELEPAVDRAELVIETVVEDAAVTRELLARVERAAAPGTVIATDTSSIAIDELASALERPQAFAGMHWFNPPELVPLVEVVSGSQTAPWVADRLLGWLQALGKRPVHVRHDIAGFIANRIQYAVFREAFTLVEAGICEYEDVDEVIRSGLGARWAAVGPFEGLDLAGLDVYMAVAARLYPSLANVREPARSVAALVAAGALGCKSGRGLYGRYDDAAIAALGERRRRVLTALEGLRDDQVADHASEDS
jgi:3-hydroxybutyryl-CoA dehydrogenase